MLELVNNICKPLTIIGALNWGVIGLLGFDFVAWVFGYGALATNVVYIIVGASAVIWLITDLIENL